MRLYEQYTGSCQLLQLQQLWLPTRRRRGFFMVLTVLHLEEPALLVGFAPYTGAPQQGYSEYSIL